MTPMFFAFLLSILVISASCFRIFGTRVQSFDYQSALMGLALAPAVTAILLYIGFATLAYTAPSRLLFILLPTAVLGSIALCFRSPPAKEVSRSEIGASAIYGGILLVCAYPALLLLLTRASQHEVPHDLTTYFLQAIDINEMMRNGSKSLFEWWNYKHPAVSQPHSLSFPILLAWGFLFVEAPGYGADLLPKLLVAWTIVSLILACISVALNFGMPWGFAAGVVVLANDNLALEIWALSRDSFYLAPYFVLVVLLASSKPRENGQQIQILSKQSIATVAVLTGHTLGIVYASGLFAAYFMVAAFRFGWQLIKAPSIWLVGSILAIGGAANLVRYFNKDAASIGFEFPYYVDPFQASVLKTVTPFAVDSNIVELLKFVLSMNGINVGWMALIAAAAVVVLPRSYKALGNLADTVWLTLLLSTITCALVVSFAPIRLENLSLASAFVVNFRYGFGLGLTIQILIVCSAAVLAQAALGFVSNLRASRWIEVSIAMTLAASIFLLGTGNWTPRPENESSPSWQRETACRTARSRDPRKILIDDTNMLYICRGSFVNAYSPQGILITGVSGDQNIAAQLDAQQIDAVVLYTAPTRWSGTRLYKYLQANWKEAYSAPNRAVVFIRP